MTNENRITLYENDFYDSGERKEETRNIVIFKLSDEWYGLEASRIREVIEVKNITYLPSSPAHIMGIINLRGTIMSITDLKVLLNLPAQDITENTRYIIIENENVQTGLLADEVYKIMNVPLSKIKPALTTIASEKADYLEGECKFDQKLIGILRVNKILETREK